MGTQGVTRSSHLLLLILVLAVLAPVLVQGVASACALERLCTRVLVGVVEYLATLNDLFHRLVRDGMHKR